MNVLFVHQNFPGQYRHIAPALAALGHRVVALGQRKPVPLPGVTYLQYGLRPADQDRPPGPGAEFEGKLRIGGAAAAAALRLREQGFQPDLIYAHPGWGESLFLKDVWPRARLVCFWEFYYSFQGADVNFDPEFMDERPEQAMRLRVKNAVNLLALEAADWGVSPTGWQKQQFPPWAQPRISVIHDGIDTELVRPDPAATLQVPGTEAVLRAGEEIVTFEAMSAGCLVVGSRTPPVTEVLRHGENGLLFDFFDGSQLVDRVVQALAEPASTEPLRRQARADMIAGFDLRSVCLPRHLALAQELATS